MNSEQRQQWDQLEQALEHAILDLVNALDGARSHPWDRLRMQEALAAHKRVDTANAALMKMLQSFLEPHD